MHTSLKLIDLYLVFIWFDYTFIFKIKVGKTQSLFDLTFKMGNEKSLNDSEDGKIPLSQLVDKGRRKKNCSKVEKYRYDHTFLNT